MQRRRESEHPSAAGLKAVDLSFHLFDRSIHPELFAARRGVAIERGAFTARLHLTSVGHVLAFAFGKTTLSETLCPASQPLPKKRKRLERKIVDGVEETTSLAGGASYSFTLGVRRCRPAEFVDLQEKALASPPGTLLDAGERPDRWHGLRSLSWIRHEFAAGALVVRAFHTLPSDFALIETTSRFVLPNA